MRHILNALVAFFLICNFYVECQTQKNTPGSAINVYRVFNADSLAGFDEVAARTSAISEDFVGPELKVRMNQLKQRYINDKYNLWPNPQTAKQYNPLQPLSAALPGCLNEDFEASTAAVITSSSQIAGWNIVSGHNQTSGAVTGTAAPYYPGGANGANSCNLLGCCPMPPQESELITIPPGGYSDPNINPSYKIFSVFGSSQGDPGGEIYNPQIPQGLFGDNIIRLNSGTANYGITRLSKTFSVSTSNALFQFAFITVFATGHNCCDAGSLQVKLKNASTGLPLTCPSFSASGCAGSPTPIDFYDCFTGNPVNISTSLMFNKWQVSSIDLSPYINQSISIDVIVSDCTAGSHYSYAYFDAQCGPMTVYANNTTYAATGPSITIPTCGTPGATVCAISGMGPYSWTGPGVPAGYSVPSFTNQCLTSNISTTYTLTMNPPGACAPLSRIITTTITPAPALYANVIQATCGNTMAVVSVTPAGSASNPQSLSWFPPPATLNSTSVTATYPSPLGSTTVTINAADAVGCIATATAVINPMQAPQTFTVNNISPSPSVTCSNPTVNLIVTSNFTNTLLYSWQGPGASNSGTATSVTAQNAGVYTVIATDPSNNCIASRTITIGVNTILPTSTLSPTSQVINCGIVPTAATLSAGNGQGNLSNRIYNPMGGSYISNNAIVPNYLPGAVGVYTCVSLDNTNGCSVTKTFTISSPQGFPSFTLNTAPLNFVLGCTTTSVLTAHIIGAHTNTVIGGNQVPTTGAVTYSILSPSSSTLLPSFPALLSANSSPTLNVPGTWTVVVRDNQTGCDTRVPMSVIQDITPPGVYVSTVSSTLNCNSPSVTFYGTSSYSNVSFYWYGYTITINGSALPLSANAAAPTTSLIGNYTLTATNVDNNCKSSTVVPVYQNIYPPVAAIANIGIPNITCSGALTLTNSSTSGIPGGTFPNTQPVVVSMWDGPAPQVSLALSATYTATVPGTYTLVVKDPNNGCTAKKQISVGNNVIYPPLNAHNVVFPLCPSPTSTLYPLFVGGNVNAYTYNWAAPPQAITGANGTQTLSASTAGIYTLTAQDPSNACKTVLTFTVVDCVGVNEINGAEISAMKLVPNPTTDKVQISFILKTAGNCSIFLRDALGREIKSVISPTSYGSGEIKMNLDLGDLSEGLYFVHLRAGNSEHLGKLVISR